MKKIDFWPKKHEKVKIFAKKKSIFLLGKSIFGPPKKKQIFDPKTEKTKSDFWPKIETKMIVLAKK